MKYYLIIALTISSATLPAQSLNFDSLIQKDASAAFEYYESLSDCNGCDEYRLSALSSIALHFYLKREYDTALTLYNRALLESDNFTNLHPNLYKRIADVYNRKSQYDTAQSILRKGVKIAEQERQFHQMGRMYNSYGISSRRMSRLDSSLYYYDLALKAYQQSEQTKEKTEDELIKDYANIYKNKGIIYATLSIDELALENFLKAISMEEKGNLKEQLAKSYLNIGVFYQGIKNFEKFKEVVRKAMYLNDSLGVMVGLSLCHNNLGNYYIRYTSKTDSAGYHFGKALQYARASKNKYYQALALQNLGNYHLDMTNYDSAEIYTNESIAIREAIGDQLGKANTAVNLARLRIAKNQPGAEEILFDAIEVFETRGVPEGLLDTYSTLIQFYENKGHYQDASKYHHLRTALKDSLNKEELFSKVSNLEIKSEVEQYQEELDSQAILLAQNKKINYLLSVVILLFIVVVGGMIYAYTKLKSYSAALEEKNHRIDTLMRELHHRVKNNLQVISSLLGLQSMSIKDEAAKKLVEEGKSRVRAMSLIHQNLYKEANSTSIDTKEYVEQMIHELARSYGMDEKVKLDIQVPDTSLDVDTSLPLGLIINELVSNAFKYAYQDIKEPLLQLKLTMEDKNGQLIIADNGAGVSADYSIEQSESFGLKLVNMLTEQLNGSLSIHKEHGLKYELVFTL